MIKSTTENNLPNFAIQGVNLASKGLGAEAIFATNEFFAPLTRMLDDAPAIFVPDKYDENGKWMDGWESRRRRGAGNDYAIIKLAAHGQILGFDVDTSHFIGNYPPACKIEGCISDDHMPNEEAVWHELMAMTPLRAGIGEDAHHYVACDSDQVYSHVRINIYPDGGIARLRIYGKPKLEAGDQSGIDQREGFITLSAALNGARILGFSDAHFGEYRRLLAPGRGLNMGDGWETARRREPGHDWIVIQLAAKGYIDELLLDTAYFKGNFPEKFSLQGADMSHFGGGLDQAIITASLFWPELLEAQSLKGDHIHEYKLKQNQSPVTHVRLNIHPDGGVSRLKCFGRLASATARRRISLEPQPM